MDFQWHLKNGGMTVLGLQVRLLNASFDMGVVPMAGVVHVSLYPVQREG